MSSAYRGYWLNGSKKAGFTAMPFNGSDGSINGLPDTRMKDPATGGVLRTTLNAVKKAIDQFKQAENSNNAA